MFDTFLENLFSWFGRLSFDSLIIFTVAAFLVIYLVCLVLALKCERFKKVSKRPFLCFANVYTAVVLAFFLTECETAHALFWAAVFWIAAYLLYGTLCLASSARVKKTAREPQYAEAVSSQPPPRLMLPRPSPADIPAARNSVRLEHAASVTEKLLEKDLGKSDRQELERLKSTLSVLQNKGTLSAAESEILNENFNMLLKLMAKYNM